MGIFTSIEILFFALGVLTTCSVGGLVFFARRFSFRWPTAAFAAVTAFLALLTAAWCLSSLIEGEPQAAGMGLLVGGCATLVVAGFLRRSVLKGKRIEEKKVALGPFLECEE